MEGGEKEGERELGGGETTSTSSSSRGGVILYICK